MSSGRGWRKELGDDPLYQHLSAARRRAYRAGRKEKDNARRRRKRATDPDYRDKQRARRYGLTLQQFRAILARQGHACGICRRSDRPLCIDHDHVTGKVRGFLCRKCNFGLGCYEDNPSYTRAATAYLEAARGNEPSCGPAPARHRASSARFAAVIFTHLIAAVPHDARARVDWQRSPDTARGLSSFVSWASPKSLSRNLVLRGGKDVCGTRASHASKRKSRKKSVGSTKDCRTSPKPASRPSRHQPSAVSGKSQVATWFQNLVPFGAPSIRSTTACSCARSARAMRGGPRRRGASARRAGRNPARPDGAADRLHQAKLVVGREVMDRQAAPGRVRVLGPAHHGGDEIAVVEIDLERQPGEIGGGEFEGGLRQVDAVIVADFRSALVASASVCP